MKQTQFVTEIIIKDDKPIIIVRNPRGDVVRICYEAKEMTSFLEEVITSLTSNPSN